MSEHTLRRMADLERRAEHDRVQSGASTVIAARASTAAGQSIANLTTTIVNYGTVTFDTHGRILTGASWVFTAGTAGYYEVTASVVFASTTTWAATEVCQVMAYKNGAIWSILDYKDNFTAAATFAFVAGTDRVPMLVGDQIDIRVYQGSGAALALHTDATYNYVSIARE